MLALVLSGGARAEVCAGDCNGDGQVSINELVTAVSIALGGAPVTSCEAADPNGDGQVSIDELILAVAHALDGCGATPDLDAVRASATVAAAPFVNVLDFGAVGANAARAAAAAAVARPAQASGCTTYTCYLFGAVTGSETDCCVGTQYSVQASGCTFDAADGSVVDRDGSFTVDGQSNAVCSGIPIGESFQAQFNSFFMRVTDPNGAFELSIADFTEAFAAQPGGCLTDQDQTLGFGIRGDGTRQLAGGQRVISGDSYGVHSDVQTQVNNLTLLVNSDASSGPCVVSAGIDGGIEVVDHVALADVVTTFDALGVAETHDGNDLLLAYDGTIGTTCLGEVGLNTTEPLRLRNDNPCPVGGVVRVMLPSGTSIITYTPTGGLAYDFGADGTIDQTVDSCEQVATQACSLPPTPQACAPCSGPQDCSTGLVCAPCSYACTGQGTRCSPPNDFAACADGIY
jgi:hypothetical protein